MKILFFVRSALMTVVFVIVTLILSTIIIINNLTFARRAWDNAFIITWGKISCALFNVTVNVHHPENIPDAGAVFLFNHSSYLDIFVLLAAAPGIRFGAKKELFKIPIFGYAMERSGTLPIARASRDEVFKVYSEAQGRIKNKEKFALAPEGGRFFGENLGPFKAGPFIFAISSGAIISPVVIKGVHEVLPKTGFLANKNQWHSEIDVYFLDSIDTSKYTLDDRQELQKIVYDKMNSHWIKQKISF